MVVPQTSQGVGAVGERGRNGGQEGGGWTEERKIEGKVGSRETPGEEIEASSIDGR